MATEERQANIALRKLVFEEFHGLSFFRAVQLIELLDSRRQVGESLSPADEPVRFKVKPNMGFPPSDIAGVREAVDGKTVEMQVTFMGLLDVAGRASALVHHACHGAPCRKGFNADLVSRHLPSPADLALLPGMEEEPVCRQLPGRKAGSLFRLSSESDRPGYRGAGRQNRFSVRFPCLFRRTDGAAGLLRRCY